MSNRDMFLMLCARLSLALCFFLALPGAAQAGNSLPPVHAAFGGTFTTNDLQGNNCINVNGITFACNCAGGTAPKFALRVINDAPGPGLKGGGNFNFCSSGAPTTQSEFNGAYQIDDSVPGGVGCRKANANTGACSCPAGTYSEHLQTIVDVGGGAFIGSHIYVCMKPASPPVSFGGVYQQDDAGGFCRTTNQYSGACSCPAGFSGVPTRVLINGTGGIGGSTIYTCYPAQPTVEICPGQFADPTGRNDASTAINACVAAAGVGGTFELPAGTYLMQSPLQIISSVTVKTKLVAPADEACGLSTPCATLVASPTFSAQHGIIVVPSGVNSVTLDHLILDGNRYNRLGSASASQCAAGTNSYGFNANILNSSNSKLNKIISKDALCGSGFSFVGDGAIITNNTFANNGSHTSTNMWADGLTYATASDSPAVASTITGNKFIDNSDIGMLIASGKGATVSGNTITQTHVTAYGGLMLDNLNGARHGNFVGANISGNTITCAPGKCFYAMQLGPRPWYPSAPIVGGSVTNNTISGGFFGINIAAAGTAANPITVSNNAISGINGTSYTCAGTTLTPSSVNQYASQKTGTQTVTSMQVTENPCYGP